MSVVRKHAVLLAGCSFLALSASAALADQPVLLPNSLIVASETYDKTQGPIATLQPGVTKLAGSKTATSTAVAGNDFVRVWDNDSADGDFGVTAPIKLTTMTPQSGHVFGAVTVPTDQVVGSFSSNRSSACTSRPMRAARILSCLDTAERASALLMSRILTRRPARTRPIP